MGIKYKHRRVAPMVEHRIPNPGVGGSSPSTPATTFITNEAYKALVIINDIF